MLAHLLQVFQSWSKLLNSSTHPTEGSAFEHFTAVPGDGRGGDDETKKFKNRITVENCEIMSCA